MVFNKIGDGGDAKPLNKDWPPLDTRGWPDMGVGYIGGNGDF